MTNTQKASEIAENESRFYKRLESGELTSSKIDCKKSALAMAEWKDQQFKELLYKWLNDDGKIDITKGSIEELLNEIDNEF